MTQVDEIAVLTKNLIVAMSSFWSRVPEVFLLPGRLFVLAVVCSLNNLKHPTSHISSLWLSLSLLARSLALSGAV